jgi:hypothetical protein
MPVPDAREVDWDNPIRGVAFDSITTASATLPFKPLEATSLGDPSSVVASNPDTTPLEGRSLALIYDSPKYGKVDVIESLPDLPVDDWPHAVKTMVADNDPRIWSASAYEIDFADGTVAFLTVANEGEPSQIEWPEGGTQVSLAGPVLRKDDAVAIAQELHSSWRSA